MESCCPIEISLSHLGRVVGYVYAFRGTKERENRLPRYVKPGKNNYNSEKSRDSEEVKRAVKQTIYSRRRYIPSCVAQKRPFPKMAAASIVGVKEKRGGGGGGFSRRKKSGIWLASRRFYYTRQDSPRQAGRPVLTRLSAGIAEYPGCCSQ